METYPNEIAAIFAEADRLAAEARSIEAAAVQRLRQTGPVRHGVEIPVTLSGVY